MAKLEYDSRVTQTDIQRAKSAFAEEILRRALNYASYVDELNAELLKEICKQCLDTKRLTKSNMIFLFLTCHFRFAKI